MLQFLGKLDIRVTNSVHKRKRVGWLGDSNSLHYIGIQTSFFAEIGQLDEGGTFYNM